MLLRRVQRVADYRLLSDPLRRFVRSCAPFALPAALRLASGDRESDVSGAEISSALAKDAVAARNLLDAFEAVGVDLKA